MRAGSYVVIVLNRWTQEGMFLIDHGLFVWARNAGFPSGEPLRTSENPPHNGHTDSIESKVSCRDVLCHFFLKVRNRGSMVCTFLRFVLFGLGSAHALSPFKMSWFGNNGGGILTIYYQTCYKP